MKSFVFLSIIILTISCDFKVDKKIDFDTSSKTEVEFYSSDETIKSNYPFSDAVIIDNFIILSGVVGNIPGNEKVVDGGIQAETKQAMENIKTILELVKRFINLAYEIALSFKILSISPKKVPK